METELDLKPPAKPASPPPPKVPTKPAASAGKGWHSMDTAPKDGTYVYLLGEKWVPGVSLPNEWYFYNTRQMRKGCWQAVGWWRPRFGPNGPPTFMPTGWRRVSEGFE